ncbi:hypothetical protein BURPSS13_C0168 [Burkholderia pseudomallei S13]|nr:hypothetical protein BURPSS13_C0168 [Burkholderia pseudomallei S13]
MPTMRSGVSDAMPRMRWVRAAFEAPLCCSLNVINNRIVAITKVALTRRVRPGLTKPRSASVHCQCRMAASAGNRLVSA